jgi:hypothetical protein
MRFGGALCPPAALPFAGGDLNRANPTGMVDETGGKGV